VYIEAVPQLVRVGCKAGHATNTATAAPQNQANCNAEKGAWCVAMRPLLKVRLMCKAGHAEERAAFRIRSTAKSIAPCRVHL